MLALAKKPSESAVIMTEMVLPQHTNAQNTIFGGVVMSWIDIAAAIAATRHSGRNCVTASIDELHFLRPIKKGYIVNIRAYITAVHRSSCEIKVSVDAENPVSGEFFHTSDAFLTFVSLDDLGHPTPMPSLIVETDAEKKLQSEAILRRDHRKQFKKKLERGAS